MSEKDQDRLREQHMYDSLPPDPMEKSALSIQDRWEQQNDLISIESEEDYKKRIEAFDEALRKAGL